MASLALLKQSLITARPLVRSMATPVLAGSIPEARELLRSQPSHYIIASIVGKRLILTPRDLVTVPRLKDVNPGDVLQLNAVEELGSREYTLRGTPYIGEDVVSVSATVVEHTKGTMERIVKFKRRKGYKKTIKHKQTYTRLRVNDIEITKP